MTRPLALVAALFVVLALAAEARAEEVLVLEDGSVLRGTILKETPEVLVIRMSGLTEEVRLSVEKSRIVRRFTSTAPTMSLKPPLPEHPDWSANATPVDPTPVSTPTPGPSAPAPTDLPLEEPTVGSENFFQRLARVVVLSLPSDRTSQSALAMLLFVALLALVVMGGRLAEIDLMGWGRATLMAALLGAMLAVDIFFHEQTLRADRAVWMLPIQAVLWMLSALVLLRCGLARSVMLLAFVLFSLGVVAFSAGAILVTF
ncbi:MAG: hypothetical protein ACYTG6_07330 [Planctomycetota bacterium]|jgi:hypothetical protein